MKKLFGVILILGVMISCKKDEEEPKGSGLTISVDGTSYFYKVVTSISQLDDPDILINGGSCFTDCFNTYRAEPTEGPFDLIEMEIKTENTISSIESLASEVFTLANDDDPIRLIMSMDEVSVVPDENTVSEITIFSVTKISEDDGFIDYIVRGEFSGIYINPETEETFDVEGSVELPAFVSPE